MFIAVDLPVETGCVWRFIKKSRRHSRSLTVGDCLRYLPTLRSTNKSGTGLNLKSELLDIYAPLKPKSFLYTDARAGGLMQKFFQPFRVARDHGRRGQQLIFVA